MPTLVLDDIPSDIYDLLQRRAAAGHRPISEEAVLLLDKALQATKPAPRLPDYVPGEEIPAPCDLPRSSQPEPVAFYVGQPRLPDPLPDDGSQG